MSIRSTIFRTVVIGCAISAAHAASTTTAPPAPVKPLRIATGPALKGYSKLFADIKAVCGDQVPLAEVNTEGGLQNLNALSANQAELGFVQVDTLHDMRDSDESIANLQAVAGLNSNLLHILVSNKEYSDSTSFISLGLSSKPIQSMGDLKKKPVAVVGSARNLVRSLDRSHNLGMEFVDAENDDDAIRDLRKGKVAAVFITSGWPSGPLLKLNVNSGLRLLAYDLPVQSPYKTATRNYDNLNAFRVSFLAAPNLLVSRPFSSGGAYQRAVQTLQKCLQQALPDLKDGAYQPAWREISSINDSYGWGKSRNAATPQ
jgi:TRAP-type uncharacterized transport system substrate-binding protein